MANSESNPRPLATKRGEPTEVLRSPLNQGLPGQTANCIESIGVFSEALGMAGCISSSMLPHLCHAMGECSGWSCCGFAKLIRQGAVVLPLVLPPNAALGCAVCPILLGAPLKTVKTNNHCSIPSPSRFDPTFSCSSRLRSWV